MKHIFYLFIIICALFAGCKKQAFIEPLSHVDSSGIELPKDTALFHDTVRLSFASGFEEVLINKKIIKDRKKDGFVLYGEIKDIDSLDVSIVNSYGHYNFTSLKGIEYFTKLRYLDMSASYVKTIDLSKNAKLEYLDCSGASFGAGWNQTVKKLDITKCKNLRYLDCSINLLASLDISQNLKLEQLYCLGNNLKRIDVSNNRLLRVLDVSVNREMTELYLRNCPELEELFFSENNFKDIDVSALKKLRVLNCSGNWKDPLFATLDISNNILLVTLDISSTPLKSIDLSKDKRLRNLNCYSVNFNSIDLSALQELRIFDCSFSELINIDLQNNKNLEVLDIVGSKLMDLDLSKNSDLRSFLAFSKIT